MVDPGEPISELVMQDLEAALLATTGPDAAYWHTIKKVVRHEEYDDDLLVYPACMVLGLDTNEDDGTFHSQQNITLNYRIVGVLENWGDLAADSRRLMADIKKAILVDHTRGGHALDTHITRTVPFLFDGETGQRGGGVVIGNIHLRHLRANPYAI